MTRFIVVRHGACDFNDQGKYCSYTDRPLTPIGRAQAEAVRQRLEAVRLDSVYSSDRSRAQETASIIASGHPVEVVACRELQEIHYGELEGLSPAEAVGRYIQQVKASRFRADEFEFPGGEAVMGVLTRVNSFFQDLARRHQEGTVLVVTHGGAIKLLLVEILGLSLSKPIWELFRLLNLSCGGVTVIDTSEQASIIVTMNDCAHLAGIGDDGAGSVV